MGDNTPTGVRVRLPADENTCADQAVCSNKAALEQLDGFSVNPRFSVCFSAPINVGSAQGAISIVPVGNPDQPIAVNQLIANENSTCIYGKPDHALLQTSNYLLLIKPSITDAAGSPVVASSQMSSCLIGKSGYCKNLANAIQQARVTGVLGASLFTTMSVTGWLQDAFRFVDNTEFGVVIPAGFPFVFNVDSIQSFIWNPGANAQMDPQTIPTKPALNDVGKVAFGFYVSPNYLNTTGPSAGLITTSGNQPVGIPQLLGGLTAGFAPVSFHVFLPRSAPPPGGYPVVIYGHGLGDSQFGAPTYIASTLARSGFATVAMEITGHGFGSDSTVTIVDDQGSHQVSTAGRGVALSSGKIGAADGCIAPGPFAVRDCNRQTAVDVYALIRTIQRSGGLGLNLSGDRIGYIGQSLGSIYGTMLQAVTPDALTAVFNGVGGPFVDVARLALNGRPLGNFYLAGLGLLNNVDGKQHEAYFYKDQFNDNYPFRDQPIKVNTIAGAMPIQAAFESAEWLGMLGDAVSYAPYLKTAPLGGNGPKNTLLQFGVGDLEVPNPANATFLKAAGPDSVSSVFEFPAALKLGLGGIDDLAYIPGFPILPHRILANPTIFLQPYETPFALAEQQSAATFLSSGGTVVTSPDQFLGTGSNPLFGGAELLTPGLNYWIQP